MKVDIRTKPYKTDKCTLCNTANVEYEFHFVCHCHLYNNVRKTLYEDVLAINTNFFHFTAKDKFSFL